MEGGRDQCLSLEDNAMAKLVVADKGESLRAKISSLAGTGTATVAAVIMTMQGSTIEGSR